MDIFQPGPNLWLQDLFGPGWQGFMSTVSALGISWGILLVTGISLWLWGRRALYAVLVVVILEALAKKAVAAAFPVDRPSGAEMVRYEIVEGVPSFPSGHVSTATTLWAALAFLGRIPLWVALVVGTVVATTRLYLGAHWLPDVVAGVCLGLLMAWIGIRGLGGLADRMDDIPGKAWVGIGVAAVALAGARVAFALGDTGYAWSATAFIGGAGLALPLERRREAGTSATLSTRAAASRIVVGTGGLVVFFLGATAWEAPVQVLGAAVFLATLWCFLGAPLAFDRWPGVFGGTVPSSGDPARRAGGTRPSPAETPEPSHG